MLGDKTPQEGLRLLNTAFDAGIGHFDVARYYGYGDAEDLVGALVKGRRDRVTITSKFGLQPLRQVAQSKAAIRFVRRLMRYSPYLRDLARRRLVVDTLVQDGGFDIDSVRRSLETSLRKLKTDYIDVFLLHECDPEDCVSLDLLNSLVHARAEGKIRSCGVGAACRNVEIIGRDAPAFSQVTQFESTIEVPGIHPGGRPGHPFNRTRLESKPHKLGGDGLNLRRHGLPLAYNRRREWAEESEDTRHHELLGTMRYNED